MVVPMLSLQENHITIIYLLGKTWENHIIIIYLLEIILHWFCLCFKIYLLVIDIGGSTMPLRLVPFTATGGAVEYHGIGAAARVCSPQGRVAWPKTHRELPRWPIGDESKPQKKHFVSKLWMKIHWSAILMFAMGQGELTHGQVIHLSDSWDFSLSLSNMDRHKHGAMRLNYEAAEMVQNALYAEKIEVPVKALSGKLYVRSLDLDWTGADLGKQMWYGCRKFGAQRVQFQLIFYFGNSTFGQITIRRISLGRWDETKNSCHQIRCQGISAHIYNHIEVGPSARGS